jgi:glycosyltransferase involved in cell wall biosynthesis
MISSLKIKALEMMYSSNAVNGDRSELLKSVRPARSSTMSRAKSLLVDVSIIINSDARTGIQRVVRAILAELLKYPPDGFVVLPVFATSKNEYRYCPSKSVNAFLELDNLSLSGKRIVIKPGDVFFGLDLATLLLSKHQKQLMRWKVKGAKIHIMVYDLLPVISPEWFNARTTVNFYRWLQTVAIIADGVTCISNTVKNDFHQWLHSRYGMQKEDIPAQVLSLGADIIASTPSKGLPSNSNEMLEVFKSRRSALMVGTIEPRKGHLEILKAFEAVWASGESANLVIVGKQGWKSGKLFNLINTHPQNGHQLFWLDSVSDEYLGQIYQVVTCVIVASFNEGFGLPIIEALSQDRPVIARRIPVFTELQYENIIYFENKTTSKRLAKLILEVLGDYTNVDTIKNYKKEIKPIMKWRDATNKLSTYISQQYMLPSS